MNKQSNPRVAVLLSAFYCLALLLVFAPPASAEGGKEHDPKRSPVKGCNPGSAIICQGSPDQGLLIGVTYPSPMPIGPIGPQIPPEPVLDHEYINCVGSLLLDGFSIEEAEEICDD